MTGSFTTFRTRQSVPAPTSGFSSLKLFKACEFCRRRKMKCVLLHGQNVCETCRKHGRACNFGCKQMDSKSLLQRKRARTVMAVENVLAEPIHDPEAADMATPTPALFNMVPSLFRRWNLLTTSHATTPVPAQNSSNLQVNDEGSLDLYHLKVEPNTPFLPKLDSHHIDQLCEWCIRIAADDNPQTASDVSVYSLESLVSSERDWSPTTLACFLMLPLHMRVSSDTISDSLSQFGKWIDDNPDVLLNPDPNLFAGAMVVDAWTSLTRETPLQTDLAGLDIFERFTDIDENCFSYQMLSVGRMLYELLSVISRGDDSPDKRDFWSSQRKALLSFEYDMLIWPVRLSMDLSVVADNLQATSEALVLHVLHNTLMIAYYGTAALKKGEYAKNIALHSIPGLYLFISGMARSNFVVGPRIRERWSIIAECEIVTARYLLELNREMPFDDFKASLHFFLKDRDLKMFQTPQAISIFEQIDRLLDGFSYSDSVKDGAAIYWVFRDTRSMTLELYLNE